MFVHNDWITSNLKNRMLDQKLNFIAKINVKKSNYCSLNFEKEANATAKLIKSNFDTKICVAFSGGIDSEYVVRVFHRNNIDFIPVIVLCDNNLQETKYAVDICKELNIVPEIIHLKNDDLKKIVFEDILIKLKSVGLYAAPHLFASYYAKRKNYTLVCGAEMLDSEGHISQTKIGLNDWDIYPYGLYPEVSVSIPFFYYTPNLFFSFVDSIDRCSNNTIQEFKSSLYGVKNRKKIRPTYSKINTNIFFQLKNNESKNYYIFDEVKDFNDC